MRIAYFSDVHTEYKFHQTRTPWTDKFPLDLGPCLDRDKDRLGKVDLVVLAGDIGYIMPPDHMTGSIDYAEQVGEYFNCPVVLVPGNHEYWDANFERAREHALANRNNNVTVLDRGETFFGVGPNALRVLGATLWTDYKISGNQPQAMVVAATRFPDHGKAGIKTGLLNRNFLPEDALKEHTLSRKWLIDKLEEPHDGPTLIVTHHVPHSIAKHPNYPLDVSAAPYYSDCNDVFEAATTVNVVGWIFGHHHWPVEDELYGTKLLSAQVGYSFESNVWKGVQYIDL